MNEEKAFEKFCEQLSKETILAIDGVMLLVKEEFHNELIDFEEQENDTKSV